MQVSSVNQLLTADCRFAPALGKFSAHVWKTLFAYFRIKFVSNIRYQFYSIYPLLELLEV